MNKYLSFGIGILLLISPLSASAQATAAGTNASLIATLTALVAQLEQELMQLLAARGTTPITNTPPATTPTACTTYASLKVGDTDATTGGQVSMAQAFLGISQKTGYYGSQTSIAYQNKCGGLGNMQPTSVAGMTKYTESSFGFSFWYPSGWKVTPEPNGGIPTAEFTGVYDQNGKLLFTIQEVSASDGDLIGSSQFDENKYYFDSQKSIWMMQHLTHADTNTGTPPQPADISANTMGGLHMFSRQSYDDQIIPLSATKFVHIEDNVSAAQGSTLKPLPLAKTLVATDPKVAIPVSTAQQTATIQAEASAYGVSSNTCPLGASNSECLAGYHATSRPSYTDANGCIFYTLQCAPDEANLSASPTSGAASLSVRFATTPADNETISFGDNSPIAKMPGICYMSNASGTTGECPVAGSIYHSYTTPGTYTAKLYDVSGTVLATQQITVTGSSLSSSQTYANTQYGFSFQYPSNLSVQTSGYGSLHPFNTQPLAYIHLGGEGGKFPGSTVPQTEGYLTVNTNPNLNDTFACLGSGTGIPKVSIGGTIFQQEDSMSGGVNGDSRDYVTFHNGTCYDIELNSFPSACISSGCSNRQWSLQTLTTLLNQLDTIAQTFRFLN